jgi:hypothetical protein
MLLLCSGFTHAPMLLVKESVAFIAEKYQGTTTLQYGYDTTDMPCNLNWEIKDGVV